MIRQNVYRISKMSVCSPGPDSSPGNRNGESVKVSGFNYC